MSFDDSNISPGYDQDLPPIVPLDKKLVLKSVWQAEVDSLRARLAAADSDRESLRACVVRLAACMERIIELHRLEYLVGQEDGGRVAHAMRDAKKELTALHESVKGDAK